MDRHRTLFEVVRATVLGPHGRLDANVRRAAAAGGDLPEDLASLARRVRDEASTLTDDDVARLRASGHTDDALFEIVLSAAVGAASVRYEAARRAMGRR